MAAWRAYEAGSARGVRISLVAHATIASRPVQLRVSAQLVAGTARTASISCSSDLALLRVSA